MDGVGTRRRTARLCGPRACADVTNASWVSVTLFRGVARRGADGSLLNREHHTSQVRRTHVDRVKRPYPSSVTPRR